MSEDMHMALLNYVIDQSKNTTRDIWAGRITAAEARRRIKAANVLLRGAKDREDLTVLRSRIEAIFRPSRLTPSR